MISVGHHTNRPTSVGELRAAGYTPRSVKQELRDNVIRRLTNHEPLFTGIIGFDDTVIPQLVNALLSKHDILLLGLRGQAKTRIIRTLPQLLDEWIPTVAGAELPDDPLAPQFKQTKMILDERGDDSELRWIHRDERFNEKLATPDVTVADLIGEIDLVKYAEGRSLADESILHYGLIPRSNRGIFAINELPDLAPRIQVSLFNVLEERDVQIRGFPVRLNLDLCIIFSANPEDYTNRGRIVTPLKDRIGSVIRTHYPDRVEDAIEITTQNAWLARENGERVIDMPRYMHEIIEEVVRLARKSPHINQQSGVSVRASIASAENALSNAERRALRLGENRIVPRMSDLPNIAASCRGKIELMLAEDEKSEGKLVTALIGEAVKNVFANYGEETDLETIVEQFSDSKVSLEVGDHVSSESLVEACSRVKGLKKAAARICRAVNLSDGDAANLASAAEFVLEALYINNRITKYAYHGRTLFKR